MNRISSAIASPDVKRITVAIDASGGIPMGMISDFLDLIKAGLKGRTDYRMDLWFFDTKIHDHTLFTAHNIDELDKLKPSAFGGTLLDENWKYMKANNIEPDLLIVMSDGEFEPISHKHAKYCPTMFALRNPYCGVSGTFGETVYF